MKLGGGRIRNKDISPRIQNSRAFTFCIAVSSAKSRTWRSEEGNALSFNCYACTSFLWVSFGEEDVLYDDFLVEESKEE